MTIQGLAHQSGVTNVTNETQQPADEPQTENGNGVSIVILGAVLVALGVFFVRRAL